MPVPEDGYPLELRDELFGLFRKCLGSPQAEDRFKKAAEAVGRRATGSWVKAAYIDDRTPRYLEVLRQAAGLAPAEGPFAREVGIARILFNQGLFFDCHEFLEPCWKAASGTQKLSLQGLIQAGAGFHKLEQGSTEGCAHLLREASRKLAASSGPALRAFAHAIAGSAEAAERGELTVEQAPQLAPDGLDL